ncbi:putative lysosomal cobalamin transporter [Talaromyces atroroseus]|uniref:Probable lysosomal cobalamin transporter n=1 Tax=Talaromyces atroroseus TaxID=1441469 RepID=A0A225AIB4_TALAT|nr:putative lysosomal cobalamin transporter [Talaromyces atroroseus]OKL56868.1 putative lysosomal cobalamin transporter [Talaromyces atroroseus]
MASFRRDNKSQTSPTSLIHSSIRSLNHGDDTMAGFLQSSLIWIVYAIVVAVLLAVASIFIYIYQTPRDRSPFVTLVSIITITALLATVLLQPVDVALVSSTTSSKLGRRKDWASQEQVDKIVFSLKVVYYLLYSLDAVLCLLVVPFTYFWYEEYDEVAAEEGEQTVGKRLWGAFKYTIAFILLAAILFLAGFFIPIRGLEGDRDLDFFKKLLTEGHGERALTFALGLLLTLGTCLYVLYTSAGFAFLPITLIKTAPTISNPSLKASTTSQLEGNRERQRQLNARCGGDPDQLSSKDRRELDGLVREERTLIRRQRLIEEAQGSGRSWLIRVWYKVETVFRPFKLLGGIVLLLVAILIWVSMLLTAIDKAKNSVCKQNCGYILAHINVFNPVNWIFVQSARVFPVDYVLFALVVLLFFTSSVVGIATVGIRFLWIRIFQIRKGHTSPQALLLATVMLTLITLALNYAMSMIVAPQYATFGPQTFCDKSLSSSANAQPDCSNDRDLVKPCTELADNPSAKAVCTPSVVSTFFNRVTLNFPYFGVIIFWAQFAFLGLYLLFLITSLFRTPKLDERQIDEDAEEAEEEGLLASTGRRFNATWQDIRDESA